MYDIAIVGAGINGSSVAYEMIKAGKKVIIFDGDGIAYGGSGAAGAFISPKFSKAGELKELIDKAFDYSMDFYDKNFPHLLTKAPLQHINHDGEKFPLIDAGIVSAEPMCNALCKGATFIKENVEDIYYEDDYWVLNEVYSAKEVVLATGAYKQVISEPYIQLRGVWGHRIDIKTSTLNDKSIHQFVSISPSKDGVLAIGATHNLDYHPQTSKEPYDVAEGRLELLEKASRTIDLKDVEVIKDYTGLRSGSFDYMPLVGSLVLCNETLECCERKVKIKKANYDDFIYYPSLYMINGNGGYGFVLAPYLAKKLSEHILSGKKLDDRLSPARFFHRWAKRNSKELL